MSVIPTGYTELSIEYGIPGDAGPAYTVLGLQPPGATSISTQASDIDTILDTSPGLKQYINTAVTIDRFTLRFTSSPGVTEILVTEAGYAGLQTGDPSPPQVAVLVQKSTGLSGRKNRGRMYLPGPVDAGVESSGLLTTTYLAQLQSAVDAFGDDLSTAGYAPVVLHTEAADTPTPINEFVVVRKVATQRRRLR